MTETILKWLYMFLIMSTFITFITFRPSALQTHPTQARSKDRASKAANVVEETSPSSLDDLHQVFRVYSIQSRVEPLRVTVIAYGHKLDMKLDTGSAASIISEDTFKSLFQE